MNRAIIAAAVDRLTAAGVDSPRVDAELLFAHVLGVDRGRLIAADDPTDTQAALLDEWLDRRAAREPLQHIVGSASFGPIDLAVGPGVFVPRPETEAILEWAGAVCSGIDHPRVVDLCSGSGALAIAVATTVPDATVIAVENDPDALIWLRDNVTRAVEGVRRRLTVIHGDVRSHDVLGPDTADLVVSNPPYVPVGADLSPEVIEHDPAVAVFAGADGMSVITPMIGLIAHALVPGGRCAIEHDDTTADLVVAELRGHGGFDEITARADLAGRPRFVTARRTAEASRDDVQG
ncbi:peptide chain release factor N(5)-glutamine methyltransferase [Williamsia phyllosphaerae]|uniref:Release factor glutamine methyltransferase n=1 Tax=Williamsia phyllosphaerae TaxID=885042 RepID=A0ABQ1UYR5_9NOCA|nr:peptide chain release factor N(5)-glutamine methyltransferase [Williamsia phyllosphaerae]GGF30732.1 release factor glutamine methyltransferase [Williamsia phyllosphaerae]